MASVKSKWTLKVLICYSISVTVLFIIHSTDDSNGNDFAESQQFFSSQNVIIIGTVKDSASTLQPLLLKLDEIANHFNDAKYIIFESNSEDDTLNILLQWKGSDRSKIILNDDASIADVLGSNLSTIRPKGREEVYVEYRNMMLYFAEKHAVSPSNTFLTMIDLDAVSITNSWPFILNEVYFAMKRPESKSDIVCLNALAVNAPYGMRDHYAIVDEEDNWIRGFVYDMLDDALLFPYRVYQYLWWKYLIVIQNQLWPLQRLRFLDVKSCFGGLAFYYPLSRIIESECKYIHFDDLRGMKSPNVYDSQLIVQRLRNKYALRDRNVNVTSVSMSDHGKLNTKLDRRKGFPRSVMVFTICLIISGLTLNLWSNGINQWMLKRAVDLQSDDLLFEDYRVQYYMRDFYDLRTTINITELKLEMDGDPDSDGFRRTKLLKYDSSNWISGHLDLIRPSKHKDPILHPVYVRNIGEIIRKFASRSNTHCNTFLAIFDDYFSNHHTAHLPILVKSRLLSNRYGIIWDFNHHRHWKYVHSVEALDTEWSSKTNKVVYRGHGKTGQQMGRHSMRLDFVEQYGDDEKHYDIGHSEEGPFTPKRSIKGWLTVAQQLKFKYIVSIEGNDVASGLQWQLYSNSVVFMADPTCETWLMHGMLRPFEHYVPLLYNDSLKKWDLNEKYQWCLDHDQECHQIALNGRHWVQRFLNPDKEFYVKQQIIDRYCNNFNFVS